MKNNKNGANAHSQPLTNISKNTQKLKKKQLKHFYKTVKINNKPIKQKPLKTLQNNKNGGNAQSQHF